MRNHTDSAGHSAVLVPSFVETAKGSKSAQIPANGLDTWFWQVPNPRTALGQYVEKWFIHKRFGIGCVKKMVEIVKFLVVNPWTIAYGCEHLHLSKV